MVCVFTHYLELLLIRAPDSDAKLWLAKVLVDEYGEGSEGHDHAELYGRFLDATGGDHRDRLAMRVPGPALRFIDTHRRLVRSQPFLAGLGAVGPGHEWAIPEMFHAVIPGLRRAGFTEAEIGYFTLHVEQDDDHGAWLEEALVDYAVTAEARAQIRRGALASLDARDRFWDGVAAPGDLLPPAPHGAPGRPDRPIRDRGAGGDRVGRPRRHPTPGAPGASPRSPHPADPRRTARGQSQPQLRSPLPEDLAPGGHVTKRITFIATKKNLDPTERELYEMNLVLEITGKKRAFMDLGILTVAAATPPIADVQIVDEYVTPIDYDMDTDLVCLSAKTSCSTYAYRVADRFRSRGDPGADGGDPCVAAPRRGARARRHHRHRRGRGAVAVGGGRLRRWPARRTLRRDGLPPHGGHPHPAVEAHADPPLPVPPDPDHAGLPVSLSVLQCARHLGQRVSVQARGQRDLGAAGPAPGPAGAAAAVRGRRQLHQPGQVHQGAAQGHGAPGSGWPDPAVVGRDDPERGQRRRDARSVPRCGLLHPHPRPRVRRGGDPGPDGQEHQLRVDVPRCDRPDPRARHHRGGQLHRRVRHRHHRHLPPDPGLRATDRDPVSVPVDPQPHARHQAVRRHARRRAPRSHRLAPLRYPSRRDAARQDEPARS